MKREDVPAFEARTYWGFFRLRILRLRATARG
jgi:hypothetical protein